MASTHQSLATRATDAVRPTEIMVRSPAPPVPAAARGSARGSRSRLRVVPPGGLPPVAGPREQRTEQPESVYALKVLKNGDKRALQQQQRAPSPSRSEEATPLGGRRRQRKKARRSGATVRAASRREGAAGPAGPPGPPHPGSIWQPAAAWRRSGLRRFARIAKSQRSSGRGSYTLDFLQFVIYEPLYEDFVQFV